ncbi:MAG TPA: glycosyltransferase family 4 protein [Longimicrobiales bacterium]
MKVLYVSKALVVAAYRDKLRALAAHADVTALVPSRWGGQPPEPDHTAGASGATPRDADGSAGAGVATGAGAAVDAPAQGPRTPTALPRILTRPVLLGGHNHFHLYRGAGAVLDAVRPDLVHIDEEPYSIVTLQLAELCRMRGIPSLFFAWQNLAKRLPPPFGALRARVFRLVAGGIAGTPAAARVLRDAGYAGPLAVIPQFGVDATRFVADPAARAEVRGRLGIGEAEFVVGFGGRLVPEKGVHLLIEALPSVPGARLVVMGDGPERARLEALAARAGVAGRVHFAGYVPSTAMPTWLAALDALALPSLRTKGWAEQFGRILVEAMACEVPVVGSATGEIPEVVGEGGVVVPEGDAAALAAALRDLAAMAPDARRELGRRARAWVCGRFTQEHVARETAEFYRTLLDARPAAATPLARAATG